MTSTTCRFCLSHSKFFIFAEDESSKNCDDYYIKNIILEHFRFNIKHLNTVSKKICSSCWGKIECFHDFYTSIKTIHETVGLDDNIIKPFSDNKSKKRKKTTNAEQPLKQPYIFENDYDEILSFSNYDVETYDVYPSQSNILDFTDSDQIITTSKAEVIDFDLFQKQIWAELKNLNILNQKLKAEIQNNKVFFNTKISDIQKYIVPNEPTSSYDLLPVFPLKRETDIKAFELQLIDQDIAAQLKQRYTRYGDRFDYSFIKTNLRLLWTENLGRSYGFHDQNNTKLRLDLYVLKLMIEAAMDYCYDTNQAQLEKIMKEELRKLHPHISKKKE